MSTLFFRSCLHSVALKQQRLKSPNTKCSDKKFNDDVFNLFKVVNYYKDFFYRNKRLNIEKKKPYKKKSFKAWKLNTKYYGYLILPSLDHIKPWKKQ